MRLASTLYTSLASIAFAGAALFAVPARAADLPAAPVLPAAPAIAIPSFALSGLYVRVGVSAVFIDPHLATTVAGVSLPAAGASIATLPVSYADVGYFLTRSIAVSVSGGFPPHLASDGSGALTPFGRLYAATVGVPTATVHYHLDFGRLHPYLGGGVGYAIVFHNSPAFLQTPELHNSFAPVLTGGVDLDITKHVSFFFDAKKMWLSQKLTGTIVPLPGVPLTLPVSARIRTDPLLTTAGLGYKF